jgi:hypothetical protein
VNRFHLCARSGIIAGAVSANSVLFAWRNSISNKHQFIEALTVKWRTLTGFPTEQEIALSVLPVTAFGSPAANYTGGTDLSDYTGGSAVVATNAIKPRAKNRSNQALVLRSALESGNVRIATTQALAHAGSPTLATHPWIADGIVELAANAALPRGFLDIFWEAPRRSDHLVDYEALWPLPPENGFVITNPIALGATGTGRLIVEADFIES